MKDWLNKFLPYASLLGLVIFLSIASPYFATPGNISSVVRQTSVITIMAIAILRTNRICPLRIQIFWVPDQK